MKFQDFIGLYQLSKTLRFELIPQGKTLENINASGYLERDTQRAEDYAVVKGLIDDYHKAYIDEQLSTFKIDETLLDDIDKLMNSSDVDDKKKFENAKADLRKQIAKHLKSTDKYKRIGKKKLITDDLPHFVKDENKELVKKFKGFTTYFTGFYESRDNMYSAEAKSMAIAFRLIDVNLPKFIDNMRSYKQIIATPEIAANVIEMGKILEVGNIDDIFTLGYYSSVLTQKQIAIYNSVIGGKTDKNKKIQGLNEYVNLYNQGHPKSKLPKLKMLYKQILSDKEDISWLPEKFESDGELLVAINKYLENSKEALSGAKSLLMSLGDYDLSGIYIRNDQQLTSISNAICGDWKKIQNCLIEKLKRDIKSKRNETDDDFNDRCIKIYKSVKSFSITTLNDALPDNKALVDYFNSQSDNVFAKLDEAQKNASTLLNNAYPDNKNLIQDKDSIALIKELLDSAKAVQRFVSPLLGTGDEGEKDERFYGELQLLYDQIDQITLLYDKVRNYVTRKPYSEEKLKLNFDNAQLLGGWDENKVEDYLSVILRKGDNFYLGIINKNNKKVLSKKNAPSNGDCYQKMIYKLLPGANKMLPKVFFSEKNIGIFNPSDEIKSIYEKGSFKKGIGFNLNDCRKLIDFFKDAISRHNDWCNFGFEFSDTSTYEDISGFYREVEQQGYKLSSQDVSAAYIDRLVTEGKLYLFQIYNKDFSTHSKGTPNMHTLYWKMLFDPRNLKDVVYKLNGQAEMFYRKKSIESKKPTHPANIPIKNKNMLNQKAESIFDYDLIKNRRYVTDKFLLHVPITLNFKSSGRPNIDKMTLEYLRGADDVHIIGIDRGERNLLYLVVIDQCGNIKEQISLNQICNTCGDCTYTTDYHSLLTTRQNEMHKARQDWQTINSIKELKEGYLSQVIHKISELILKYHAIIVLEDLNSGFKQSRQKVESAVYQKFEKMLIDKLSYLVDKSADINEPSGLLKAYQLSSEFESFAKMGRQSGFLFYVPTWNTSKIDPTTGFVNLFDTRYESVSKSKEFFSKFDDIRYNSSKGYFEFEFDYNNFHKRADGTRTKWTLCSYSDRIETFRNSGNNSQWDSQEIELTNEFISLFNKFKVEYTIDLKQSIIAQESKEFFVDLMRLIRLTLQMRNSKTGTNIDYIISPVVNEKGCFFDSRNGDSSLPQDADANGAYNIARKGLMMISQIKMADSMKDLKFDLTNKAWLKFAQE